MSKKLKVLIALMIVVIIAGVWVLARVFSDVPYTIRDVSRTVDYSEDELVLNAMSMSYLSYGCENAEKNEGTVNDILDNNKMGILIENAGIYRTDVSDPGSAVINSSEFIASNIGEYRFLSDKKDEATGFYGVAFCDDYNKCVWVSFSGTVTMSDVWSCVGFVCCPWLSSQERSAFDFMNEVMRSDEINNQDYTVILTGHSLGGALATEISLVSGNRAVTINGADGLSYDKITLMKCQDFQCNNVTNYMTSGSGSELSLLNIVQRLMFFGSNEKVDERVFEPNDKTTDVHCVFSFIDYREGKYALPVT